MSDVVLKHITKRYTPDVTAVRDVSFEVKSGEFCVLVGPSGCGKSTTLRMVAGLEEITEGELQIGGRVVNNVAPRDRDIAMVFQSYALYPHMTVYENMAFGLRIRKMPNREIDTRVQEAAKTLGISEYLQRKPKALSGGQRQRVAMGRAIVRNPQVFLFDEPLSNLDAQLRLQMRIEIARLHRRLGATTLYVTHDQVEAMTLADRIAVLKDGDLQQYDSPLNIYKKPANRFVATFIGSPSMNLLSGERQGDRFVGEGFDIGLPENLTADVAEIGVRPQAFELCEDGTLVGEVDFVEALGSETFVHFMWGNTGIVAQVPAHLTIGAGDIVKFKVDPTALHLFDSAGVAL